ncbi:MAG: hypothetical protein WBV26_05840, partial [Candidatus Sulfotelmatobacter sp.]
DWDFRASNKTCRNGKAAREAALYSVLPLRPDPKLFVALQRAAGRGHVTKPVVAPFGTRAST